jgi:predicted dehydrogenase
VISHGIARIAEHIKSDHPTVTAHGFTSPLLRSLGERTLRDELRVLVHDDSTTGYFTFSSQMRPQVSEFRVFGPKHGILIDDAHHALVKLNGTRQKSYLDMIGPALGLSSQYLANAARNLRGVVTGTLNMNNGMKELIDRFYQSIIGDAPLPIPFREILLTSRITDAVFEQILERRTDSLPNRRAVAS